MFDKQTFPSPVMEYIRLDGPICCQSYPEYSMGAIPFPVLSLTLHVDWIKLSLHDFIWLTVKICNEDSFENNSQEII